MLLATLGFRDPWQTVGRGLRETVMTRPRRAYKNLERETVYLKTFDVKYEYKAWFVESA
ncbi:MAG: hypothetical protein QXE24_02120 [Desulfurococcaceae archaeon]